MSITPSNSVQSAASSEACSVTSPAQDGPSFLPTVSLGEGIALNPHAQEFFPMAESVDVASGSSQWLSRQSTVSAEGQGNVGRSVNARDGHENTNHNDLTGDLSSSLEAAQLLHGRSSGTARQGRLEQSNADGVTLQAASASSSGRKGQMLNANHLLNFHYDPIPRHTPRNPPPRRQVRKQSYSKELFLQANFRFLVSDFGDYMSNSSNPDKMLQWEDVAAVSFSATCPVQCPICFETPPLCPQITSCGHIFCFPCILRYLLMGEEDNKGDHWKKCPLCFATICCKDLRTVSIDSVKQYQVADYIDLTLLTRAKSCMIPFEKSQYTSHTFPYSKDGKCNAFSKFTLTSDADQLTNWAKMELTTWAERVQYEQGEDLELLPYVFAAIDQLELRRKSWVEHRGLQFLSSSPSVRQRLMDQAKSGITKLPFVEANGGQKSRELKAYGFDSEACMKAIKNTTGEPVSVTNGEPENLPFCKYESAFSDDESNNARRLLARPVKSRTNPLQSQAHRDTPKEVKTQSQAHKNDIKEVKTSEPLDDWENFTELLLGDGDGSLEKTQDTKIPQDTELCKHQEGKKESEDAESYSFYQSADGQLVILHPISMKCILHYYGSHELLPSRISGKILEMEMVTQSEAIRKRYRYLSHFPLTTSFQLCEIDLSDFLPASAFIPFIDEIRNRGSRRRWRMKQEQEQKARDERKAAAAAAAAAAVRAKPSIPEFMTVGPSIHDEGSLSSFHFEEGLGGPAGTSMSPPVFDERKLFSRVTRLGFAAGHDAPALNDAQSADLSSGSLASVSASTGTQTVGERSEIGTGRTSPMSFVDIIMAPPKPSEQEEIRQASAPQNSGKRGKKATKILLSTAGGRRY